MRFYVASKIENRENVAKLVKTLTLRGHKCTYDWSVHGSVQAEPEKWAPTAEAEVRGVLDADLTVVLLPGGRGTHVEIGLALASIDPGRRALVLVGPETSHDGRTCVFYHHLDIGRFDDVDQFLDWVDAWWSA